MLRVAGNQTAVHCELTALSSSFQKPQKPPTYANGPNFASEICSRSTLFHLEEFFRGNPYSCSKISFRGSLFIEKLVPGSGGTNFGGSIFTMTDLTSTQLALIHLVAVLQQEGGNNSHQRFKTQTFKS